MQSHKIIIIKKKREREGGIMRKSKVSLKSALVLTLFTANIIHSSGVVPVIGEAITAYADVYYSYNPDDECGVNGDSKQKMER